VAKPEMMIFDVFGLGMVGFSSLMSFDVRVLRNMMLKSFFSPPTYDFVLGNMKFGFR
jgi:hypothetical protein